MKRRNVVLLVFCMSLLLTGCSTAKMIKRSMDLRSISMKYEMDSVPPVTRKKNVTLSVAPAKFDPTMMNKTTVMKKGKLLLLPLVVINVWERYDTCIQGRSAYKDDFPTFFQSTLVKEINYSGSVQATTDNQSDYTLELSIDNLKVEGPYKRSGLTFLILLSRSEMAGPAVSTLKVTYTLKKGDQVVKQNTFNSSKTNLWANRKYTDNALMQVDYAASMVEATAQNFKKINKLIVGDLDDYFRRMN